MPARKSTAVMRAEKVAAAAKKRAANLREKMKKDQPLIIASTVAGGVVDGFIQSQQPEWLNNLGVDSSLLVGGVLVGYGLFSDRAGQLEKTATAIGTGVLTCYASRMTEEAMS